jgi:Family of unknown function (DUF5330)
MGLIRKIIVVGGALMAMPNAPHSTPDQNGSSSWTYISAAAETVSDFKGFCDRKPQVCVTAQYLAQSLEGKAKYSAKLVYEWANESTSGKPQQVKLLDGVAKINDIKTGSIEPKLASAPTRIEDLIPEWRGTLLPEKG